MNYTFEYKSTIGALIIESDGENITRLGIKGQKYFTCTKEDETRQLDLPIFLETKKWLDIYFSGQEPKFTPPVALKGTDFRISVWEILSTIPYGKVVSYGDIAKKIAKQTGIEKMSAQAVGGAVGHNPISIIIPCHRVVGAKGNMTGFASGIDNKIKLLKLENIYDSVINNCTDKIML